MQKWIYKNKNKKGFTLIELVVVIAILGILAAIAVPRLAGMQDRAKVKADYANAKLIGNAAEVAYVEEKIADGDNDTAVQTALVGADKYIASYPTPKHTGTAFAVQVSATGVITVTNGDVTLYPTPNPIPDTY